MKKLILLSFLLLSTQLWATDITGQVEKLVLTQARMTFSYLGDQLQLDLLKTVCHEQHIYVEIAIGTQHRPHRIHNCFIATISNNGVDYISNLEQQWDQPCEITE